MELFLKKKEEKQKDRRIGLEKNQIYDTVVLGLGPAGFSAALYAARKNLKVALVGKEAGGQLLKTWEIENYPGIPKITGFDLMTKMQEQVSVYPISYEEERTIVAITQKENLWQIELDNQTFILSKTVIIATGKKPRKLGVEGEEEFTGKGVSYCTTCDAPLFTNKVVAVSGGGNSGAGAVIELSRIAQKVYWISSKKQPLADAVLLEKIKTTPNIIPYFQTRIQSIRGEGFVKDIIIENVEDKRKETLLVDGVFVESGLIPNTDFRVEPALQLNEKQEIIINSKCETNLKGIFAAGDVTNVPEKQIVIAAGEGAKAALSAFEYLQHLQ